MSNFTMGPMGTFRVSKNLRDAPLEVGKFLGDIMPHWL